MSEIGPNWLNQHSLLHATLQVSIAPFKVQLATAGSACWQRISLYYGSLPVGLNHKNVPVQILQILQTDIANSTALVPEKFLPHTYIWYLTARWLLWWSCNFGRNLPLYRCRPSTNILEQHTK